jgi:hypothetical protein
MALSKAKGLQMNRLWIATVVMSIALMTGCTDTEMASAQAYGKPHHIKQFACGTLIGEWTSTGKVMSAEHSDGYRFEDSRTHKIVEVSGTVQITLE